MRITILAAALCLSAAGLAAAADADAAIRRTTNIPAQGLGPALNTLAKDRDLQVVYRSEVVGALKTNGASGDFTADEALAQLLSGTGLTYRYIDERTITIFAASDAQSSSSSLATPIEVQRVAMQAAGEGVGPEAERAQDGASGTAQEDRDANDKRTGKSTASADGATGAKQEQEITVTGSHIRGVKNEALPVVSITREDIRDSGLSTLPELMNSLPQNFRTEADTAGTNAANLRGLGIKYTLVLINGRRAASSFEGSGVDTSAIPLGSIERVEILTDGAAAAYGSDAVGGVINIILRDNFNGAETGLYYGDDTQGSGFHNWRATQSLGTAWGTGNVLLNYTFQGQNSLHADTRPAVTGPAEVYTGFELINPSDKHGLQAVVEQQVGERWEFYGQGRANRNEGEVMFIYGGAPYNLISNTNENSGLTVGARLSLGHGWRLDGAAGYDESTVDQLFEFLDSPAEPFGQFLSGKITMFDLRADGELFALPGGTARAAIGAQYLTQKYFGYSGDFVFVDNTRDTPSMYGEVLVPLVGQGNRRTGVERLELTAAARFEDYDEFGDPLKPRFSLLWEIVAGVRLRGSWGQSFKAPSLYDISGLTNTPQRSALFVVKPDTAANGGSALAIVRSGYGPALQPEESTSWTVGVDLTPEWLRGARLSLSYGDIDFTDKISSPTISLLEESAYASVIQRRPDAADVAGNAAFDQLLADVLSESDSVLYQEGVPPGTPLSDVQVVLDERVRNIAGVRSRTLDILMEYAWQTGSGDFSAELNTAYFFDQASQVSASAPKAVSINVLGRPVDLRARGKLGWSRNQWAVNGFINYTDGYRVDVGGTPIDSWTTVDLNLRYQIEQSSVEWLNGMNWSLSATNVLNQKPPYVNNTVYGVFYDAFNAEPVGRFVTLGLTKSW